MIDSFQDVYAKYLLQHADYGYPLRMPEPMSTLPQHYQEDGLQIGDVGIVDNRGQLDVLFNICKRSDNPLHDSHGVPKDFQSVQYGNVKSSDNVIPAGPIHSHGIERVLQPNGPRPADYEFDSSTPAGAILILPHGATSVELLSPEQFCEVATKNALDWYNFAKKRYGVQHLDRSLYLITGFYKARSWSLGSFNNPSDARGKILARRDDNNHNIYLLEFSLPADHRHSFGDGSRVNQTVFITGFRITVRSWLPDPVVLKATESETTWFILVCLFKACLNWVRGLSGSLTWPATISVEHSPKLSEPFHPSDIINRFLLSQKPGAEVAITHDNQWMDMMKEGLTPEDLLHEDRLGRFLTRRYTVSVDSEHDDSTVFLQGKFDDTMDSDFSKVDPQDPPPEPEMSGPLASEFELEVSSSPSSELELSPPPTPSLDNPCIVITRIRAQDIAFPLNRVPVGFYVLVQVGGDQRRTQIKSIRLNDSSIKWEDEILLPFRAFENVRFTVYAPFELEPMLGNGEVLHTSESPIEELVGGTHLITFSSGESGTATSDPSLLVTLEQWYSSHLVAALSSDDSNLDLEDSSDLIRDTDLGQEALLRYHREYQREYLDRAVQHFERASQDCPPAHRHHAAVLANLAKAKFISYQTDPTSANLDEPIRLYRQALVLRCRGHVDRPATLLQLAQTLLFRYEKQGCDESIAVEINELMAESQDFPEDGHERRATDLVLETLKRCRVVNSGGLAELDELVSILKDSAKVPPDGYFDRLQRLINLSTTLWGCYEKHGKLSILNYLLEINKQTLQLLPSHHPDRLPGLRTLANVLWRLFEVHEDLSYLRELIDLCEDTLQLAPEGHPEHPYWVNNLSVLHCSFL